MSFSLSDSFSFSNSLFFNLKNSIKGHESSIDVANNIHILKADRNWSFSQFDLLLYHISLISSTVYLYHSLLPKIHSIPSTSLLGILIILLNPFFVGSLGINSAFCRAARQAKEIDQTVSMLTPINDSDTDLRGSKIACSPPTFNEAYRAFLQGAPDAVITGALLKQKIVELRNHRFDGCDSVPLSGNDPNAMGIFTVNYGGDSDKSSKDGSCAVITASALALGSEKATMTASSTFVALTTADVEVCLDNNYCDDFFDVSGAVSSGIAKGILVRKLSACIIVPSYLDNRHPPGLHPIAQISI